MQTAQTCGVSFARSQDAVNSGTDESPDRQEAFCILHTRVVDRERRSPERSCIAGNSRRPSPQFPHGSEMQDSGLLGPEVVYSPRRPETWRRNFSVERDTSCKLASCAKGCCAADRHGPPWDLCVGQRRHVQDWRAGDEECGGVACMNHGQLPNSLFRLTNRICRFSVLALHVLRASSLAL